ncbi:hypothetical protein AEA09_10165 [Lysinibacillus contaminans]|uniref:DUF4030 domain-containing protein n=1 Tax=Lysinibacillus contaminans TaxID=1293441 RepID=A0ABR5K1S2_9BACI|nr:DUF4030 domain-containing protein [Lysinibacillus contaminans]KOS68868.1 hypothetical protein AEA09_10165 [Lysinibacillus contaminans]
MKDPLNDQLKELSEVLNIEVKHQQALKQRILLQQTAPKRSYKKYWLAVVAMCLLFLLSPFYSSTMANLAAKILHLDIQPSYSEDRAINSDITGQIVELIQQEGYEVSFVGATPSPFTIKIGVTLTNTPLKDVKKHLQPIVETFLYENGIDDYKLVIREAEQLEERPKRLSKTNAVYESARQIVKDVFTKFGFEEEANYELAGLKDNLYSYTLKIDMPDHIKEQEDIIDTIEKEIEAHDLDIQEIEVTTFNFKHRMQSNRWGYIASDIYDALIGKSRYQVTGLSYKVKKGHSNVYLKTDWEQPPTNEITEEITNAINTYLQLPEVQEQMENDPYTIKLLLKNEDAFITITN